MSIVMSFLTEMPISVIGSTPLPAQHFHHVVEAVSTHSNILLGCFAKSPRKRAREQMWASKRDIVVLTMWRGEIERGGWRGLRQGLQSMR